MAKAYLLGDLSLVQVNDEHHVLVASDKNLRHALGCETHAAKVFEALMLQVPDHSPPSAC
jgi:hypothetical protein